LAKGIAYQHNDVLLKFLSEKFKGKSFKAYGLDLPPIQRLLPTNLPVVQADEKRSDNVFLLDKYIILLLEYESQVKKGDLYKYGTYGWRILEAHSGDVDENGQEIDYQMVIVVIYTGNVKTAPARLDKGSHQLQIHQIFLSQLDGEALYADLRGKITNREPLTDDDLMRLIILPLTGKARDQDYVESVINLAKGIEDETQQVFAISGILTATDKFIDQEYANQIREWLRMTKVARLFEEEKIEAVNQAVSQTEARKSREIAKIFLDNGADALLVMKATGLTREELAKLQGEHIA
jgi:hypothetical protein